MKKIRGRNPDLVADYYEEPDSAQILCTTIPKMRLFRKYGMLKYLKHGRNFVYKKSWLDEFAETWAGYDLSNEDQIKRSIFEKERRERMGV